MRKNVFFHSNVDQLGFRAQVAAGVGTLSRWFGPYAGGGYLRALDTAPWDLNYEAVTHVGAFVRLEAPEGSTYTQPWFAGFFYVRVHPDFIGTIHLCITKIARVGDSQTILRSGFDGSLFDDCAGQATIYAVPYAD